MGNQIVWKMTGRIQPSFHLNRGAKEDLLNHICLEICRLQVWNFEESDLPNIFFVKWE